MSGVLIVAAFEPELRALRAWLDSTSRSDVSLATVGIGLAAAGAGAERALARCGADLPGHVVLVGTCGVYPVASSSNRMGDVLVARRVLLADGGACEGKAAFPEVMPRVFSTEESFAMAHASVRVDGFSVHMGDVATTLTITTDDALAASIAHATRAVGEHLEAFAVASACASRGVPFVAALGIANVVGASARAQWKTHHIEAARRAQSVVRQVIEATPSTGARRESFEGS